MEHMAKQTAIDFLLSELRTYVLKKNDIRLVRPCIDQAKRIEKEQALQTFKAGQDSMEEGGKSFDQWYETTYGKTN